MNVNAQQYIMYESYNKSCFINILVSPDMIKSTILYLGATFKSVSPVGCSPQGIRWMSIIFIITTTTITEPTLKTPHQCKTTMEAEQQEWLKCDKINSYERFSSDVKVHIQSSFPSVFVHQSEDHVLLYKLNHSDDTSRSVSVSLTIRIYKNMTLLCG